MLSFDQTTHAYAWNGKPVPHVTGILQRAGIADMSWVTRYALERGTALHKACELYDQDDLDEATVDPACEGFLAAYKKFRAESQAKVIHIEKAVYSRAYGYAGCLDRLFDLSGFLVVVDLKCNALPHWIGMQLGAYYQAALEEGITARKAFGLALRPDGTYRLRPVDCAAGLYDFLQALKQVGKAKGLASEGDPRKTEDHTCARRGAQETGASTVPDTNAGGSAQDRISCAGREPQGLK